MRVLVTGATGFLGSHLVDRCLDRGDHVRVLVRKNSDLSYLKTLKGLEFEWGDLSDQSSLLKASQNRDVIFHSAARVNDYGSRDDFYEANVFGTQRLLNAARENRVGRFIFISSPSICMDMKDQLNIDETYPLPKRFVNLYSETKAAAENLVLAANSHHFLTTALRPRAIWGPRDRSGFLPQIVSAMAKGKMLDISGGNKILASLCHAENAVEACILASQSSAVGGKAYFITDQEVVDVWEFASKLAALFEVQPIRKKINPFLARSIARGFDSIWKIPGLSNHYAPPISSYRVGLLTLSGTFSTRSAERDFGYKARMSQEVGLSRLKHWINSAGGVASLGR